MSSSDRIVSLSKFLSYVLRHYPESIGLELDDQGWANVQSLLECANKKGKKIDRALLDEIVSTNNKKRFSYSEDGSRIRAAQGHSSKTVKIEYDLMKPPSTLYHGTSTRFLNSIWEKGLIPGGRHHVHLSADEETAKNVGARHGHPVVLTVDSGAMFGEGLNFYQADNGVWLTDHVPVKFLSKKA